MIVTCPYCDEPACLVSGEHVYPHRKDLAGKHFYKCEPCAAWVGCHPDTKRPMGRLANAELRRLKSRAHAAFDPLWLETAMSRDDAYSWLATQLGLPRESCHIGEFDADTCTRIISICTDWRAA